MQRAAAGECGAVTVGADTLLMAAALAAVAAWLGGSTELGMVPLLVPALVLLLHLPIAVSLACGLVGCLALPLAQTGRLAAAATAAVMTVAIAVTQARMLSLMLLLFSITAAALWHRRLDLATQPAALPGLLAPWLGSSFLLPAAGSVMGYACLGLVYPLLAAAVALGAACANPLVRPLPRGVSRGVAVCMVLASMDVAWGSLHGG